LSVLDSGKKIKEQFVLGMILFISVSYEGDFIRPLLFYLWASNHESDCRIF